MLIGLTALGTESIYAKGCNRTALAAAFWFTKNGHSVALISPNKATNAFSEIEKILTEKNIKIVLLDELVTSKKVFDVIYEIGWYVPEHLRLQIAKRHVMWFHQPPLFNDMESSTYYFNNLIRTMKNVAEVWIPECFPADDKMYIERIYSIPVRTVPWIWEHISLDTYCARSQLDKWNQYNNPETQLVVLESNNTNTSNCTLPLCIIAEIVKIVPQQWIVSNGEQLKNNKYFKGNVLNNLFEGKDVSGNFVGRIPIPELRKFKSVLITHQRWKPLKHHLLDAIWLNIPMIHNCQIIASAINKSGGYFYEGNTISTAVNKYTEIVDDIKNSAGYFSKQAEVQRRMFCLTQYDWNSDKIQTFFSAAIATPLPPILPLSPTPSIKEIKEITIAFADMWFEFNPKYNFFTCLLENAGIKVNVVEDKPNLVIFGPFGDNHRKYDGIPKIFFSGENTPHIEGPEIVASVGHSLEQTSKTLRMPLWILEVNWFNADPTQIRNPKPIPYDICTKPQVSYLSKKTEFAAYIVSNPKNEHRNAAFTEISQYKKVDSAGGHLNNMGFKLEGGLGGGGGEMAKHEFLQKYKFNVCFENASAPGYITEKYLHAKAAGCIPIYWGDPQLSRDFNPDGGINTHGKTWAEIRDIIKDVDTNTMKYLQMYSIPAITPETEAYARKQMGRLLEFMKPFVKDTSSSIPTKVHEIEEEKSTSPFLIPARSHPKFYTAANSKFMPNVPLWLEGLSNSKIPLENVTVYYWLDASSQIPALKQKYSTVSFIPFPENEPSEIPWRDYWEPQHYGWKLWIMYKNLEDPGIYMDAGVLLVRPIPDVYDAITTNGLFILEDENINKNWCHEKFVKMMNCSEDELNSKQLQAAVIGWDIRSGSAKKVLTHGFYYTKARDILVGEKWIQNPPTHVYGHRHDQSILSILTYREKMKREKLSAYTTCHSYTLACEKGLAFYHHRGKAVSEGITFKKIKATAPPVKSEFAPKISEAVVINLDKRTDRYQSFKEFHAYMSDGIKRESACYGLDLQLTPEIKNLFRNNDFKWKKAVMGCAVSHNRVWQRLAANPQDDYSCLILEDDVRFYPKWLDVWQEASKMIPEDADIIYLGGILPPNKQAFGNAIALVNKHFAKVIPNEIFSPGNPRVYFHSCNYSYIMFARGARKLAKIIEERGIFTSGDHMIVNHMEKLNVYFLSPIVAGCFQDLDPIYQKSQFNNFERVDNFDSDLWNNVECFTPQELSQTNISIKPAESNDTMVDGINIECNAILLKLSQGKMEEMVHLSLAFFEKELSHVEVKERNYNWIRVIQQVLISQKNKMSDDLINEVSSKLNIYMKVTTNAVLSNIVEEILAKYKETISARIPGITYLPNVNFQLRPFHIWYFVTNQQNEFLERDWLEEIIGKPVEFLPYGASETPNAQKVNFILIQKCSAVQQMINDKLDELLKENKPAVLIHLSDENTNDDLHIYDHPAVKLVIRNYVRNDLMGNTKIITIPLGYVKNRSLKGNFKKLSDRSLVWSFAGSVDKPTRIEMLQIFSLIEPNSMKLLSTWKQPKPEEADEYMKILAESKFIPCPMGQNFETFRLYEALEAGCIPICIGDQEGRHDCYNKLIGDKSILIVKDWTSAKAMIQQISNNTDALNQIQENLTKYWTNHKANITAHILAALERISN